MFSEVINTDVPYHVFVTPYGPGNIWVEQRNHDYFVVKSDKPSVRFGWEIKAKRKGYENERLKNVDDRLNSNETLTI